MATAANYPEQRANHKSIGHYILGRTIGEGTFGKVKLGRHILSGTHVAVKVLEKERIVEVADVERIAREVHILKLIRHPHIVQLFEIIETRGQLYLIMEYARGGELFDYIVANGRVQELEACRFFHQIIAGVEKIHQMHVVHRDLKPENLLLDEHKQIKIVDFGLSNVFREGQKLSTACGSPCYAPPEMVAGLQYVPANCDLWSCGVILFALVCGYLPFEDQNTAALYKKIMAADYSFPNFISDAVRDLISGLLTADPAQRFTITRVRAHPWYQQIPEAATVSLEVSTTGKSLDEDVLRELEAYGFPRQYAVRCLEMNKHNHMTTTYWLLLERKRRVMEQLDRVSVMVDGPSEAAVPTADSSTTGVSSIDACCDALGLSHPQVAVATGASADQPVAGIRTSLGAPGTPRAASPVGADRSAYSASINLPVPCPLTPTAAGIIGCGVASAVAAACAAGASATVSAPVSSFTAPVGPYPGGPVATTATTVVPLAPAPAAVATSAAATGGASAAIAAATGKQQHGSSVQTTPRGTRRVVGAYPSTTMQGSQTSRGGSVSPRTTAAGTSGATMSATSSGCSAWRSSAQAPTIGSMSMQQPSATARIRGSSASAGSDCMWQHRGGSVDRSHSPVQTGMGPVQTGGSAVPSGHFRPVASCQASGPTTPRGVPLTPRSGTPQGTRVWRQPPTPQQQPHRTVSGGTAQQSSGSPIRTTRGLPNTTVTGWTPQSSSVRASATTPMSARQPVVMTPRSQGRAGAVTTVVSTSTSVAGSAQTRTTSSSFPRRTWR